MPNKTPPEILEYNRRYREENRERVRESNRRSYKKNREKALIRMRRYSEENRDKKREYDAKRRAADPEKNRETVRRWSKENREKANAQTLRYRARKASATIGNHTEPQKRISEIYKEPCVWCDSEDNIHVDHIWPLSKGGAHAAYNLQALCGSCNSRKGDRILPQLAAAV